MPAKHAVSLNPEVLPETTLEETALSYVDIAALEGGDAAASLSPKELTFGTAPSRARRVLRAGDTILSTVRTYLKAVANFPEASDGLVASTGFAVFRPNGRLHPRFAYWAALSEPFIENVVAHSEGVSYPAINPSVLGSLHMPMPPRLDQERIADFLDEQTARIDALIAEKDALASSLQDIAEVTAYDLVTRGIYRNVARTAHREEWLREAPAHWGLQKLRQLATVGNGSTPKRDNESYWSSGKIPWLNSGAVNAARITEASDLVTTTALKECHLPMVRAGSTVVALTGQGKTRGTASFTEIETTINQHLAYVSLFDARMSDEYLWVYLTGMYSVLRHLSDGEGSTKGALTCEQLNQLRVLLPPPDEQKEIVATYRERVNAVENLREHATLHIARLREYRSSLISAAVTGQLDLSTFKKSVQ